MNYDDDNYRDQFLQKFWDANLPVSPSRNFDVNDYYALGVIRKDDLVNGAYYYGSCRNSDIAKWDSDHDCFWYMRYKLGHAFPEKINHLADDNGFDLFVPFQRIDDKHILDRDKVK